MLIKKITILFLSFILLSSTAAAKDFAGAEAALHSETYNVSLERAVVSHPSNGRVVITMAATGDLRGALSLHLDRNPANGNITGGEWALLVAYSTVDPNEGEGGGHTHGAAGGGSPDHPGEPHSDYEKLINKGTISGTISGGTIQVNADGTVTGLDAVQLVFGGGSMEFAGFQHGAGSLSGADLQTTGDSSGAMTLVLSTH